MLLMRITPPDASVHVVKAVAVFFLLIARLYIYIFRPQARRHCRHTADTARVNLAQLLQETEYNTADTTMMLAVLFLMYLVLAAHAQSCSYRSLCSDHTMCKYQGYGRNCGRPIYSGVSNAEKQTVVDAHNNLRRQVARGRESRGTSGTQPSAANMRKLSWDDELARVAQRWADQCSFGHDKCRTIGRFSVGQNAFQSSSLGSSPNGQQDWRAAVQAWYNEVKDFNRNDISPFKFTYATGHYSQVVWADTYKVGCGFTAYKASNGWYNKLYICNYGPSGNYARGTMYKVGSACSKCSGACDNGLCV